MSFTEEDPRSRVNTQPRIPAVQGQKAAAGSVDNWRVPRTLCSLSWIDGHVGRAYITCREGTISQKTRIWANENLGKYLYVAEPQSTSHIWNEVSLMRYLDFLAEEVRCRRAQLNLSWSDKALVLMDQAGAHMSKAFETVQKKWSTANNIVPRLYIYILAQVAQVGHPIAYSLLFARYWQHF